MALRTIRLTRESFAARPALNTAVSRALLERVATGAEPETLRLYRPQALVAFGPHDGGSPGFPMACAAARAAGFEPVRRLAGGRAAVFHEETLAFAWTIPDATPAERVDQRFWDLAEIVVTALCDLGIDARIGAVPGEYCPGSHSVNARGQRKLMGVGQRVVRGAAHVGGVVVVAGSGRVRAVLSPVYRALGLAWDPATVGSVHNEFGGATWEDVERSLVHQFALRYALIEKPISLDTLTHALAVEVDHRVP